MVNLMVCGSRELYKSIDKKVEVKVEEILEKETKDLQVTKLIHGGANGVDSAAQDWAKENNIETEVFEPDYDKYNGKIAPLKRNDTMIEKSDKIIAIWDGKSSGTKYVISNAPSSKIIVYNLGNSLDNFK